MSKKRWEAVVMGGSAGALSVLSLILSQLPVNFPLPILIVVHVPPDKKSALVDVLQGKSPLAIREAEDKEPIEAGKVYFAPPDYHLLVEEDRHVALSCDEPQLFSRPSIDVLFESAAEVYSRGLIGVILSGGNNDGAKGLRAVIDEGGIGLVQSPAEAYARAMPIAALDECEQAEAMSGEEIVEFLRREGGR